MVWFLFLFSCYIVLKIDCANGPLPGIGSPNDQLDFLLSSMKQDWCTKYNTPYETSEERTQQHFAKMFFDLMADSAGFLNLEQGQDDPYTWTIGQGCGYSLAGARDPYTDVSTESILYNASRELYFIDEGVSLGALDRNLLIGGSTPAVGDYDFENPLQEVHVMQSLYIAATPQRIVDKVKNCNRPSGPIDITEDDAKEILTVSWERESDRETNETKFKQQHFWLIVLLLCDLFPLVFFYFLITDFDTNDDKFDVCLLLSP